MLLELRALADAVLIGTGTLRAEGYARLVRSEERRAARAALGLAADPPAVLLSRGLDLPWDAGLFAAPEQPVLVYTGAGGGRAAARSPRRSRSCALADPSPAARSPTCAPAASRALLCEGGPTLNSVAARRRRRSTSCSSRSRPLVTGEADAPRIVEGGELPEPLRAELALGAARRRRAVPALRAVACPPPCGSRERARSSRAGPAGWAPRPRGGCTPAARDVTIADLNAERGEALAAELGARFVACDVTDAEQVRPARRPRRRRCASRSAAPASAGRRRRAGKRGRARARAVRDA